MSDTPTTAELRAILDRYTTGPTATEAAIADLRNSPDALADLNGGEWVLSRLASHEQHEASRRFAPVGERSYIFVPREATDGND